MEVKIDVKNKKKIEHNLIQYKYLDVFYIFCLPEKYVGGWRKLSYYNIHETQKFRI